MYTNANNDVYPPDVTFLIADGLSPSAFKCPSAGTGRSCDYFYCQPQLALDPVTLVPNPAAFIACDLKGNHRGLRDALTKEDKIISLSEEEFQRELARPWNANFAAKLRQVEAP